MWEVVTRTGGVVLWKVFTRTDGVVLWEVVTRTGGVVLWKVGGVVGYHTSNQLQSGHCTDNDEHHDQQSYM